jgi:peroxiredoxin Q/BCP
MGLLTWLGLAANGKTLELGDPAPDASARDEQGREVRLADLYQSGLTLIYFYPKADTPGCTAQACSLRDDFAALQSRGVRVVGVSADSPAAQLRFKEKHHLPFTLLADEQGVLARAFGVPLILGLTHRQSFLIQGGRIIWRDLHASTREQAKDLLKVLEKLR